MAHVILLLLGALIVGAVAYGVTWVITGRDRGLDPEEPDGQAVPLPTSRPLAEHDVQTVRFDIALRGYRMDQVDAAIRRAAYDIGYKDELIGVLEAEVAALRAGETGEADALRSAREGAIRSGRGGGAAPADGETGATATDSAGAADSSVDGANGDADDDDVAADEPAIRPGATDPVPSGTPATAVTGR